ncbi:MAG: Mov34/MPN/PAD-1 family protein [Candidatus Limnocylindrus sp.]
MEILTRWKTRSKATSSGGSAPPVSLADRPKSVSLPREITSAMRAHARAEAPREACGIIVGSAPAASGGAPLRWIPTTNVLASSTLYEIDPAQLLRISLDADDAGESIWGIVHSHVASPAVPSVTDITVAGYPDALYLLVSLAPSQAAPDGEPGIRAWWIVDQVATEVELVVQA